MSLGMALRLAQRHLDDGTTDMNGLIDQAVAELGTAVVELRQIAHGLRPSSLDDGLHAALAALTQHLPIPVVLEVQPALFREGLARLLVDAGHEIVAKAGDADALESAVHEAQPDVAIIDIRMPPDHADDGARVARRLRDAYPRLGILVLSQHVETRHSVDLVASGGFGYLLKDRVLDVHDFLDALSRVAAGGSALDPEVV